MTDKRTLMAPVMLTLAALSASGCREPLPEPELRARLARQAAERNKFRSFSASYDMIIAGRRPEDGAKRKLRCSGQLVAARETGLRMRGAKALGMAKIFDLLLSGDRYRLNFIHGKKFFTGSVSKALTRRGAQRLVGGERPQLEALLFPVPPTDPRGSPGPRLVLGRRQAALVWEGEGGRPLRRIVFDAANARPLYSEIFDERGRRAATIHYIRPLEAGEFRPVGGFRMRAAGRSRFRLDMKFGKVQVNGPVNPKAFRLKVPSGVKVTDVDELPKKGTEPQGK